MGLTKIIHDAILYGSLLVMLGLHIWAQKTTSYYAKQERGRKILYYGIAVKVTNTMLFLFMVSFVIIDLSAFTRDIIGSTIFLPFVLGSFAFSLEAYLGKIIYDEITITFYSPWRGTRTILWDDIETVSYNDPFHWYVCHNKMKGKFRLSTYLSGCSEFIDEMDRHFALKGSYRVKRMW